MFAGEPAEKEQYREFTREGIKVYLPSDFSSRKVDIVYHRGLWGGRLEVKAS